MGISDLAVKKIKEDENLTEYYMNLNEIVHFKLIWIEERQRGGEVSNWKRDRERGRKENENKAVSVRSAS